MATKRKREAIKAPSEEEWNLRKKDFNELYLDKTLADVMIYMERHHNFIAS